MHIQTGAASVDHFHRTGFKFGDRIHHGPPQRTALGGRRSQTSSLLCEVACAPSVSGSWRHPGQTAMRARSATEESALSRRGSLRVYTSRPRVPSAALASFFMVSGCRSAAWWTAMKIGEASIENTGVKRRRRCGVRQLAAALIPRACSRPRSPKARYTLHGQQAGLSESGSKLPHSTALRAFSCRVVSRGSCQSSLRMTSLGAFLQQLLSFTCNVGTASSRPPRR